MSTRRFRSPLLVATIANLEKKLLEEQTVSTTEATYLVNETVVTNDQLIRKLGELEKTLDELHYPKYPSSFQRAIPSLIGGTLGAGVVAWATKDTSGESPLSIWRKVFIPGAFVCGAAVANLILDRHILKEKQRNFDEAKKTYQSILNSATVALEKK